MNFRFAEEGDSLAVVNFAENFFKPKEVPNGIIEINRFTLKINEGIKPRNSSIFKV